MENIKDTLQEPINIGCRKYKCPLCDRLLNYRKHDISDNSITSLHQEWRTVKYFDCVCGYNHTENAISDFDVIFMVITISLILLTWAGFIFGVIRVGY